MAKDDRYSETDFEKDFPDEEACLRFLFVERHGSLSCSCGGTYALMGGRRSYQCSMCRRQVSPIAGTMFHKSPTPLTAWFRAIRLFGASKSGISAAQLERDLGVTYKTAWRMLNVLRSRLGESPVLTGTVEADGTYVGGKHRQRHGMSRKSYVMAAAERKGRVVAKVVEDASSHSHKRFLDTYVSVKADLMTDQGAAYNGSVGHFKKRKTVNHSKGEYVRKDVYTNTVEGFWSHVKRSVRGVHKSVSKRHLQSYLDGYSFHWNHSRDGRDRFSRLLQVSLRA